MDTHGKYSRTEHERRFLIDCFPSERIVRRVHITDRYLDGTFLRLRAQSGEAGETIWKLTQKMQLESNGVRSIRITTIYLSEAEHSLLSQLPGSVLRKVRLSVPPLGIDLFEGVLHGLRLAEAEFDSAAEADAFVPPDFVLQEVTGDVRFTGGQLVLASPATLEQWLAEYGISLNAKATQP